MVRIKYQNIKSYILISFLNKYKYNGHMRIIFNINDIKRYII